MKKQTLLVLLFIVLGFFLRFYRLGDWLYFGMDEERDAFVVKRIIVNRHLTLIGGSVPGGFYVGPGLYYLSVLPMAAAGLNPVGLGAAASLLGVISIWLIYQTGKELFNRQVGLISAALFSASYLMVIYNRHFWPLTPAPAAALITLLCLYQIIKKSNFKYSYLLAGALIVGLQSDPSNLTLLILTISAWLIYRLPVKKKEPLAAAGLVVFSHLPLALFDLRHNFLNSRALFKLLTFSGQGEGPFKLASLIKALALFPKTFARLLLVFGDRDISRQLIGCPKYIAQREEDIPLVLLLLAGAMILFWLGKGLRSKKRENVGLKLISWQIIITLLGIMLFNLFYADYLGEYFLSVLLPSFILLFALTLVKIFPSQQSLAKIVIVFSLAAVNVYLVLTAVNFIGLKNKIEAVNYSLEQVDGRPFFLDSLSSCFRYNGIRYLFYLGGQEPVQSFMDPHYAWLYDQAPAEEKPQQGVVFVTHDESETGEFWTRYGDYLRKTIARKKFGGLEVLIVDEQK